MALLTSEGQQTVAAGVRLLGDFPGAAGIAVREAIDDGDISIAHVNQAIEALKAAIAP